MKTWIPLRIASVVTFFYAAGHSSGFPWMAPEGTENTALTSHLQSYRFDFMGSSRTVWDFHLGFGLIISLDLVVLAMTLWCLATLARRIDTALLRPILAALAVAMVAHAALVGRYFFVAPLSMALVDAVCLALALASTFRAGARDGLEAGDGRSAVAS